MKRWVVLELSHQGEKKTPQELETLLRQHLGDAVEVFVPAMTFTRRETCVTIYVMEGYVFVGAGLSTERYFDLEDTIYIQTVLSQEEADGRYLRYVPHSTVQELETKLQRLVSRSIQPGDQVCITQGAYSQLMGKILHVFPEDERATVHVTDLESMEVIVELPYQFMELVDLPSDHALESS